MAERRYLGDVAPSTPDIYGYLSHRDWLREAWEVRKSADKRFSHRWIALRAGFSSSSMFADILKGGRKITPAVAMKLASIFGLGGREARYFELLVLYDQAESEEERRKHLERLVQLRRGMVPEVQDSQMELFSRWWNLAVRELLDTYLCDGDPREIARRILPPIKPVQAKRSLELLAELGLCEKGVDGIWRKREAVLTASGMKHQRVRDYQREVLKLGTEAMDRLAPSGVDVSTLTLSVSNATLESIRAKIAETRREILEMARSDTEASEVVQLNFTLFPCAQSAKVQSR